MRIHYLQHVQFEGLANIQQWANLKNHSITATKMYAGEALPSVDDFDFLIVLGGPMNIYDEQEFPWLIKEKEFLREVIAQEKTVLGICLGAQLLAAVLGAEVISNPAKEIGWLKVKTSTESMLKNILPAEFMAFHWHGDTFLLPKEATLLGSSEGCNNQGFEMFKGKVVGVQFHLESNVDSIEALLTNCESELVAGPYIQSSAEIIQGYRHCANLYDNMVKLLDYMENATI